MLLVLLLALSLIIKAQGEWKQIRTKNFNLIGNADEKDIRQTGLRLEEFRVSLKQVLSEYRFDNPIPTTVVVFKTDADYSPFKPRKKNGESSAAVKGHFQAGRDVNYIALLVSGDPKKDYRVIFHEYAHLLIRGNVGESNIAAWLNEGFAVYYETFLSDKENEITLGTPPENLLALLKQNDLIPLDTFFNFDNLSLHEQGEESVGLFYGQSWLLTHYLINGEGGKRKSQFDSYLRMIAAGKNAKTSFAEAFQIDYQTLENDLRSYGKNKSFLIEKFKLKSKIDLDANSESKILNEAETQAYLGDLLLHSQRIVEAENLLQSALKLDPNLVMAKTSLGLIRLKQNKFDEAVIYLEDAANSDTANYLTYFYYAYALSKKGMSNLGFVIRYDSNDADKMREALKKSISLNPNYSEALDLLAFVDLVRSENLDEAIENLNRAINLAPGNQWYQIHLAELYLGKNQFERARQLVAKVANTAGDAEIKIYAQTALQRIIILEAADEEIKNNKNKPKPNGLDRELTDEELAQLRAKQLNESLNESLYRLKSGEKRILGTLLNIDCRTQEILYTVKTDDDILKLRSPSFDTVRFVSFTSEMAFSKIGCDLYDSKVEAVISFRPGTAEKNGEVISIEFVPPTFKFIN